VLTEVTANAMKPAAEDLFDLLVQRRTLLRRVYESGGPPTKRPLIDEFDYSQATVNRLIRDLCDRGMIEEGEDGLTETLLASLVWDIYRTFDRRVAALEAGETDGDPPWETDTERWEMIELITDRRAILECLAACPRDKRDLVTAVDSSRSTVDRAIRELEAAGLVGRTSGKYTTLSPVRRIVSQYRTTVERVSDVLAAQKLLAGLPPDSSIGQAILSDATVESVADSPPYHLPDGVRDRISMADRVRVFLPTLGTPRLLDCCQHVVNEGQTCELLTTPALFEILTTEFPGQLAAMAANRDGSCVASITDTDPDRMPSFGLVLAETSTTTTVSVIVYNDQDIIQGVIHNESTAAVQWAEDCDERIRSGATEVTHELRDLAPTGTVPTNQLTEVNDIARVERETEGFVRLTPSYFAQRAPAPPLTGWRAGFDLVDVHAGYALDRDVEHDGTRHNLAGDLIDRLINDTNQAVLGPPGSGKSTVCKSVACRWYEQGLGPVFYHESGTEATFDTPAVLREQLRAAAASGHVLVVVEDAVRPAANAIFEVMQAFRGTANVTFLLDAREGEWTDDELLPTDAKRDAYRHEAIETVFVPALDDTEAERFVRQFAQTTAHEVNLPPVCQLRETESVDEENQPQAQPSGDDPSELLLFLHRLVLAADPLMSYTTTTPTTLAEDVQRTYKWLEEIGPLALDIGVFVNLLNAAGIGVSPPFVCALGTTDDDLSIEAVRETLSALEGRLIFDRTASPADPYRTVHEAWSAQFLTHLREVETEHATHQRVGRCVTALLSLADEPERRTRLQSAFRGEVPAIERIATAPGEWADAIVERLFELGLHRRGLGALFGRTGEAAIDLPAACSQAVTVDCTRWRAQMAIESGDLDNAAHEYEALAGLANEVEESDAAWAATLRCQRFEGQGLVAYHRNEYDTAEAYYTRAIEHCADCDENNPVRCTTARRGLGSIALFQGDYETAETYYQDCLEIHQEQERPKRVVEILYNLGFIIEENDGIGPAIDHYQQCLDKAQMVGNRLLATASLAHLGQLAINQGPLETAETYCTQALDLARETGNREHEARTLAFLGACSLRRGDFDEADAYSRQSLDIRRQIGHRRLEAHSLKLLGVSARKRGDLDTADELCMSSLDIYREIDIQLGEAICLGELSSIVRKQGDLTTATEHAHESLRLNQESGDTLRVAVSHQRLGEVATAREQFTTAEDHLTQALTDCQEMGYRYEEVETLAALGVLERCRNDLGAAREWFEEAVAVYREIGAIRDEIETIEQLVAVYDAQGDLTTALAHCERAHNLAQETEFIEMPSSLEERRDQLVDSVEYNTD
jgi:tetratricopeptide (TPR) repeat protein/DNA-binding MarR family transcriptional regulator